ncbi:hypothetical protein K432DRAFT_427612 [Lepidopterella palustris CBS 459.81]|uniref:Linalool dehydratase/isomerase domain-containing protein n=1 Tax=Lepidopterella palustris CBS 459.81 TaxID=1314670 RepID=A0A8E2E664_9PEZI|nr:hypothetical protein K432DRAFT_427612 [Lepidopterella palustris CBS 459.81]
MGEQTTLPTKAKNPATNGKPTANGFKSYQLPKKDVFGPVTRWVAYRLAIIYIISACAGTYLWFFSPSTTLRAFGVGLVFPGAGYFALGGWGILGFVLNTLFIPVSIFGWFWAGIVQLPVGTYLGSAAIAAYRARKRESDTLLRASYPVALAAALIVAVLWTKNNQEYAVAQETLRAERNKYIDTEVRQAEGIRQATTQEEAPGSRELTEDEIKAMRYLINLTRQPLTSWKGFTHRDQFREGAYRYPLYQIVYALSSLQCSVMPNYHGALSQAQRSAMEKVLQPSVLYYWALEALWGRHSLRWDPIKWENIMLSGWYMLALMMYTSTTRDFRYTKPGSLVFRVTPFHSYSHSIHTIMDALVDNFSTARFCLYACEPNWVYTLCNLYGIEGAVMYDRIFNTNRLASILPRFKSQWFADFTTLDGGIVGVRSSISGLQLPISGACVNASTSVQAAAIFPEYADQLWAITKHEFTTRDEKGKTTAVTVGTGDCVDAGLYNLHPSALPGKSWLWLAAKEKGDKDLADHLSADLRTSAGSMVSDNCGGDYAPNVSTLTNTAFANARFNGVNSFVNTLLHGPPEYTFRGPLLADAPYPEVVVAKAWSDGEGLDLVLYDGVEKGAFELRFERLKKGERYEVGVGGKLVVADADGAASVKVWVEGRTEVLVRLVK